MPFALLVARGVAAVLEDTISEGRAAKDGVLIMIMSSLESSDDSPDS